MRPGRFDSVVRLVSLAVVATALSAQPVAATDWAQWRGPNMMAVVDGRADLPETWSATTGVVWKTRVPGLGWSSLIVWGNRIFVRSVTVDTEGELPRKGVYLPATGADIRPEPPSGQHRWKVYCLDATTGQILWERTAHLGTATSSRHPKNSYASETATTDGERVYVLYASSGYVADEHRPVYAIRPGASGDITLKAGEPSSTFVAWYQPRIGAYNPSAIVYGDYYYTLLDGGFLTCHDAKTGAEVYGRQRIEAGATVTASPWAYNGKIFALSEDGNTYVIQAGRDYKLLGKNVLDEMALASPALANGRVLIRTVAHLFSIK
jgi:outer membrane protein assembly factor BamB